MARDIKTVLVSITGADLPSDNLKYVFQAIYNSRKLIGVIATGILSKEVMGDYDCFS